MQASRMRNDGSRVLAALILVPLAGVMTLAAISGIEWVVRLLTEKSAVWDDAAVRSLSILPLLVLGYLALCWFYVLPGAWVLRRFHPLVSASVVALPVWLVALSIFHAPDLDRLAVSIVMVGVIAALPIFASAGVASRLLKLSSPQGAPTSIENRAA